MLSQFFLAKSSQKLYFATMHEKRHENAEKPENVTFCHNNAEKKRQPNAEKCDFC
jgi:hypothetical protein